MNSDNLTEQEYMPPSEVGSKLHVDKLSNSFTWVAVMYKALSWFTTLIKC